MQTSLQATSKPRYATKLILSLTSQSNGVTEYMSKVQAFLDLNPFNPKPCEIELAHELQEH
jgi:hypothetical protein